MNYVKLGKEISYALRHHPEKYHLDMDDEGWVVVNQLLDALKDKYGILDEEDIIDLMNHSDKQRYELKNLRIILHLYSQLNRLLSQQKSLYIKGFLLRQ